MTLSGARIYFAVPPPPSHSVFVFIREPVVYIPFPSPSFLFGGSVNVHRMMKSLWPTKQKTVLDSSTPLHQQSYPALIISFISFILSCPKLIILIPSLLVFILAYNVLYDFSVMKINGQLACYFNDFSILPQIDSKLYPSRNSRLSQLVADLSSIDHSISSTSNVSLSKIVISLENSNILEYKNLEILNQFDRFLTSNLNDTSLVISPFTVWPIDLDVIARQNLTTLQASKIEKFILKHINFDENTQLLTLFLDDLFKYNHLIERAQVLKTYVIHQSSTNITEVVVENHNFPFKIKEIVSTSSFVSIRDFIEYFLIQSDSLVFAKLFFTAINVLEIVAIMAFLVYVYLAIANQHKIRSNLGLLIGWIVEVIISATAAINIISYVHNYKSWRLIFEPLTTFTRSAYLLTIFVLSSRNLFRLINDLAGDNSFELNNDIHKRLFKFYLGINNSIKNSNAKIWFLNLVFGIFGIDLEKSYIPNVSKILFINILGISLLNLLGISLFKVYFAGKFMDYLSMRLLRFVEATIIALILDHLLQLTYLVGIIIIDLNRYELADLLSQESGTAASSDSASSSFDTVNDSVQLSVLEVNPISTLLLGLKSPKHLRPDKRSNRYRLGQYLLKVRPSSSLIFWTVFIPITELVHFLGIFTHWVILIPYNLFNDRQSNIVSVGYRNIIVNENSKIYYLELLTILLFIVAITQLIFKFNKFKNNNDDQNSHPTHQRGAGLGVGTGGSGGSKSNALDFEITDEVKFFKSIDLMLLNDDEGHTLDVLKLCTNPMSSFIVTIGLDHKIFVWSPLTKPTMSPPINISTTFTTPTITPKSKEFWPINHIKISNDGNHIIMINFKNGLIKCFEREQLNFSWQVSIPPEILVKYTRNKLKILESFFRKKTVPGFLARKILQKKKQLQQARPRRGSDVSILSVSSKINANFPPPPLASANDGKRSEVDEELLNLEKALNKEEFIMVLATGELITIACDDGSISVSNILTSVYDEEEQEVVEDDDSSVSTINQHRVSLTTAKKISTSRVSDRIVCNVRNNDVIIATVINNKWKIRKLPIQNDIYNTGTQLLTPQALSRTSSFIGHRDDFRSKFNEKQLLTDNNDISKAVSSNGKHFQQINKPAIATIEFVGMILRVNDLTAQLIDVQTGIILRVFNIGHFKPGSLRVAHSEPTHCKFCGCASIQSFSIIYEDFYEKTVIMHTFNLEVKRSKNNICLRVERDPREIRCIGFNAVIEHQYWYKDVELWELTDVNMIIGFRKKSIKDDDSIENVSDTSATGRSTLENGLVSLRSRKDHKRKLFSKSYDSLVKSNVINGTNSLNDIWEAFVITAFDGSLIDYKIPDGDMVKNKGLVANSINSIVKYGFKSVAVTFGNLVKILYLGNDKLIENELYYSGTNTSIGSIVNEENELNTSPNQLPSRIGANLPTSNTNELLFINKRRRMREKHKSLKLSAVVN